MNIFSNRIINKIIRTSRLIIILFTLFYIIFNMVDIQQVYNSISTMQTWLNTIFNSTNFLTGTLIFLVMLFYKKILFKRLTICIFSLLMVSVSLLFFIKYIFVSSIFITNLILFVISICICIFFITNIVIFKSSKVKTYTATDIDEPITDLKEDCLNRVEFAKV